jgi:hypothetical protein
VEGAVAIDEGAGINRRYGDLFLQTLDALCWKSVRGFGDDDPED